LVVEAAQVLFIGRAQVNSSSAAIEKRYPIVVATSGKQGIDMAGQGTARLVVLDAASMRTPGERICLTLRERIGKKPIVHIHPGPKGSAQSVADVILFTPFTTRKLLNCIDRLLYTSDDEVLSYGPFSMSLGRRVLVVNGQETPLTPKQALLVETFLRHPGETLDRKVLMEKVWQTDYLGDTRTLDVHIRWIRQLIEPDPSKPRYLQTVRGIGYRLETPPDMPFLEENKVAAIPG
jgi:DNA-binding response OmpR family regulator